MRRRLGAVLALLLLTGADYPPPQTMRQPGAAQWFGKLAIDGVPARFISITVDPEHDTPDRVALYARSLGAGSDWNMLTGDGATVRRALHKFGLDIDPKDPSDHLNVLYMANLRTGLWKKVFSLAPLDDLEQLVHQVESDRGP
jgi:cytochrome oxidase Cu insertion factor (SCO1/SenC/PrrC family)